MVEILHNGAGTLVCCKEPMALLEENTTDAAVEKHVPVVEQSGDTIKATVGSVSHPMDSDHYIEWIELISGDKAYRRFLNPGETPEVIFKTDTDDITVREYCNLHGLWRK